MRGVSRLSGKTTDGIAAFEAPWAIIHIFGGIVAMRRVFAAVALGLALLPWHSARGDGPGAGSAGAAIAPLRADAFRDDVVRFVRETAEHLALGRAEPESQAIEARWSSRYRLKQWGVSVAAYERGAVVGEGMATSQAMVDALRQAAGQAVAGFRGTRDAAQRLRALRFLVAFDYLPDRRYAFIEHAGRGLELTGNRVALRRLDAAGVAAGLDAGKRYLLRMQHPERHGWFQKYDALHDRGGSRLRTIYTASSLLSLLRLQRLRPDPAIARVVEPTAAFLLSMQVQDGPQAGAFRYSMDVLTGEKNCRLMAGTASKTIYTLLALHREYGGATYLRAARRAGDWLLTLAEPDGRVIPKVVCRGEGWSVSRRQSFLYSGQVLSALSRLHAATRDPRYYRAATRIAERTVAELARQHDFIGDDYRAPNSISTSWAAMSLSDYAAVNDDPVYLDAIDRAAAQVLWRQIRDEGDVFDHGRFLDTMSTSGNGWVVEVLGELHRACLERRRPDCGRFRDAMVAGSRWLLQNAYNAANSFDIPNPARAEGGMIGSILQKQVRTDAVGHGLNGLMNVAGAMGTDPRPWIELPERRFDETLTLLRTRSASEPDAGPENGRIPVSIGR